MVNRVEAELRMALRVEVRAASMADSIKPSTPAGMNLRTMVG